jgi:hypothetical protein
MEVKLHEFLTSVLDITIEPFYPRIKSPAVTSEKRLDGPHNLS